MTWVPLKAAHLWRNRRHITDNLDEWLNEGERTEALVGLAKVTRGGIQVPTGVWWYIPLPVMFALAGETDEPYTMITPNEVPFGVRVPNNYLSYAEQISWRNRVLDSKYQSLTLVGSLLETAIKIPLDRTARIDDGVPMTNETLLSKPETVQITVINDAIQRLRTDTSEASVRAASEIYTSAIKSTSVDVISARDRLFLAITDPTFVA